MKSTYFYPLTMDSDIDSRHPMVHSNSSKPPSNKFKEYLAASTVSLGALCAGTCLAWTSPALAQLALPQNATSQLLNTTLFLDNTQQATVGGILAIGALISAIPAGFLADFLGRKILIIILSASFLLNWLLIIFAQNANTLIAGRIFAGIGTGAICVTGPMYISEIAEQSRRGTLSAFINMFLCVGVLLTCIFGSFTTWRVLSMILATIPATFGVLMCFMPETPVFLVKRGKIEAAEQTLRDFRGDHYDVQTELKEIQKELEESGKSATFWEIIASKGNRRAFISVVAVLAFQQLCGINVVVFYTVPIFQSAGSNLSPDLAGILIGFVQVIASYLSLLIIEKADRKFYLMLSSVGMMLFMLSLGMYFHLKMLKVNVDYLGFMPIGSAILFMASFAIGYGPVPWLLMGELYSPEIKGVGSGFAIATNWSCAFLVTYFFPIINSAIGVHVSFYACAIFSAIATIYVYVVLPETRGTTLIEIQHILNR